MTIECNAWHTVSSPTGAHLEQCINLTQYSLTIEAYGEVYIVYRCQPCRDELVTKAESEGIEILDETPLLLHELVIVSKK